MRSKIENKFEKQKVEISVTIYKMIAVAVNSTTETGLLTSESNIDKLFQS